MLKNINTVVGTLCSDSAEWIQHEDELFVMTHIKIGVYTYPIVMSEYFHGAYKNKRVSCKVFPKSQRRTKNGVKRVYSFMQCSFVQSVDDSVEDTREIELEGRIKCNKIRYKFDSDNDVRASFELDCEIGFRTPVTVCVMCNAYGKVARSLLPAQKGDYYILKGYVSGGKDVLCFVAKKAKKVEVVDAVAE